MGPDEKSMKHKGRSPLPAQAEAPIASKYAKRTNTSAAVKVEGDLLMSALAGAAGEW